MRGAWGKTPAFATRWSLAHLTSAVLVDGGLAQEKTEVWKRNGLEDELGQRRVFSSYMCLLNLGDGLI